MASIASFLIAAALLLSTFQCQTSLAQVSSEDGILQGVYSSVLPIIRVADTHDGSREATLRSLPRQAQETPIGSAALSKIDPWLYTNTNPTADRTQDICLLMIFGIFLVSSAFLWFYKSKDQKDTLAAVLPKEGTRMERRFLAALEARKGRKN